MRFKSSNKLQIILGISISILTRKCVLNNGHEQQGMKLPKYNDEKMVF